MTNSLRWGPCALVLSVGALALTAAPAFGSSTKLHGAAAVQQAFKQYVRAHGGAASPTHTATDGDLVGQLAAYSWQRTAPAMTVSAQALLDAQAQAAQLPTFGGAWTEDTTKAYNANPGPPYTDPFWSNIGSGF